MNSRPRNAAVSLSDTNLTAGEGVIISRDNDADGGILISAEL